MVDESFPLVPLEVTYLVGDAMEHGLDLVVDIEYPDHVLWETEYLIGFIVMRPHYCDRGRWLLHADSKDPTKITLDWADAFPALLLRG